MNTLHCIVVAVKIQVVTSSLINKTEDARSTSEIFLKSAFFF